MGCDIHAFIDYDCDMTDWTYANSFAEEIDLPRNYLLFGLLAGVRQRIDVEPVSLPKGLPDKVSWPVERRYTIYISDVERDKVQQWLANGWSTLWRNHRITNPDWHSASWLSVDELEEVERRYDSYVANHHLIQIRNNVLAAIIAAMKMLPAGRLVFWFDN